MKTKIFFFILLDIGIITNVYPQRTLNEARDLATEKLKIIDFEKSIGINPNANYSIGSDYAVFFNTEDTITAYMFKVIRNNDYFGYIVINAINEFYPLAELVYNNTEWMPIRIIQLKDVIKKNPDFSKQNWEFNKFIYLGGQDYIASFISNRQIIYISINTKQIIPDNILNEREVMWKNKREVLANSKQSQLKTAVLSSSNSINGVNSYTWYRGCSTTALSMIIDYWGEHEYSKLDYPSSTFSWDGPDNWFIWSYCTSYNPIITKDLADLLASSMNISIQCQLLGINNWGSTSEQQRNAILSITSSKGYSFNSEIDNTYSYTKYQSEIDAGRPVKIGYYVNKKAENFHAVCGFGYNYDGVSHLLQYYNTWDTQIHWMTAENEWIDNWVTTCPQKPDLTPINQSLSISSITAGSSLTAYCEEKNSGPLVAGANVVSVYLSSDDVLTIEADRKIGEISIPAVSANSQSSIYSKSITIPTDVSPNDYHVFFWADGGQIIDEIFEKNNFATAQLTVTSATTYNPPRNLTATAGDGQVSLSWSAPSSGTPTSYQVYKGNSATNCTYYANVPSTSTSKTVTGLDNGTPYWFCVTAVYGSSESEPTDVIKAVPSSPSTVPYDEPCNADPLTVSTSCSYVPRTIIGATKSTQISDASCDQPSNVDVWFTFQIPSGTFGIHTNSLSISSNDCGLAIYTGNCSSLTERACVIGGNPTQSYMPWKDDFNLTAYAGQTGYIRVWEYGLGSQTGDFQICIYGESSSNDCTVTSITPNSVTHGPDSYSTTPGEDDIIVNAQPYCNFTVTESCSWLSVSPMSGSMNSNTSGTIGQAFLNYSIEENPSTNSRQCTFYVNGSPVTITQSGQEVNNEDFYVQNVSVPSNIIGVNGTVSVSCEQCYAGTTPEAVLGVVNLGYYLSTNNSFGSSDIQLGTDISGLGSDDPCNTETANLTIPGGTSPGTYYILFVSDYDKVYSEVNETNNVVAVKITVIAASHDFYILNEIVYPNQLLSTGIITVRCDLCYSGSSLDSELGSVHTGIYLSTDINYNSSSDTYIGGFNTSSIGSDVPIKSLSNSQLPIPSGTSPGIYYILIITDDEGEFSETNENNNIKYVKITVVSSSSSEDFYIQDYSLSSSSVAAGGTIDATCTQCYIGKILDADMSSSVVGYYLSSNTSFSSTDDIRLATDGSSLGSDYPFEIEDQTLTIPTGTTPGTYYILFVADYDGRFSESNENNNVSYNQIAVTGSSPVANLSASPTSGCTPLTVNFTDQSTNNPTSWAWDIDNNGTTDYTSQNPSHIYATPGTYSVKLTASNTGGSNSITVTNYIAVNQTFVPSVTISASVNQICSGQSVTFTATPTNGGTSPTYQWKKNGTNETTGPTYTSSTLVNGDVITCVMNSNLACASPTTATSNSITMAVSSTVTPAVSISSNPSGTICSGTSVTFTATPTNGGTSPTYQWKKNGNNVTNGSSYTSSSLVNGDVITCVMTSNLACASPTTATSNSITISVSSTVTPAVSISSNPSGAICSGTSVTFTTTPTNGGTSPTYQWKKNGTNLTTGSTYTSSSMVNGDVITCVMTSNLACASPTTATSNSIIMAVTSTVTPAVSISSNPTGAICSGTSVTFTATPTNGGTSPTYQWKKNGTNVTTGSIYSTSSLVNGDVITCVMTSNLACASPTTATSNSITLVVSSTVTPAVSISSNPSGTICSGTSVTFTATPTNGGTSPTYQWKKNGTNVTTGPTYTNSSLVNGDVITCVMTSNLACASPTTATSNSITISVSSTVTPTVTISSNPLGAICSGTSVTFTATPTSGGTSPSYQWKKNGTNVTTGSTYISSSLVNGDVITCVMTSNLACASPTTATSNSITISVTSTATPAVNISSNPLGTICSGTSVTFTATPTNGGTSPTYQWKKNGTNETTGSTYTNSSLVNGDLITCVMTSNLACASPTTATSNSIMMSVSSTVAPAVTISSNPTGAICSGTSVTFTATPTNGGTSPTYQWKKNGTNVTTGSTYTSSSLVNGDVITCVMTSNLACASPTTATSNSIPMVVSSAVTPSVSISSNYSAICSGMTVNFTATPTNSGTSPTYQWKKNGDFVATGSTYNSSSLVNGDVITCVMTSNLACASPNMAISNSITMVVYSNVPNVTIFSNPSGAICYGQNVTFTAISTEIGFFDSFDWKKNGINIAQGSTFITNDLVDGDVITCVQATTQCGGWKFFTSNSITMNVAPRVGNANKIKITYGSNPTCAGQSVCYWIQEIPGVKSYVWTLPDGQAFTTPSNVLSVNYSNPLSSGYVKVFGRNDCGDGFGDSIKMVVNEIPATPVVSIINENLISSSDLGNQWYFENTPIDNANNKTYLPSKSGLYSVYVTLNNCTSKQSNEIYYIKTGIKEILEYSGISIYPNPTKGKILISFKKPLDSDYSVKVNSILGEEIKSISNDKSITDFEIDLSSFTPGLYLIQIVTQRAQYQNKVIKE